jgi:hypothetical protein
MKLKPLAQAAAAMAIASAGVAAHADGSPFGFYALLDGGVTSTNISGGSANTGHTTEFNTGNLAPNFFGITGTKKLDGLEAGFVLEEGFNLNSSQTGLDTSVMGPTGLSNSMFNRKANLYVAGNFGKVSVGTVSNAVFEGLLATDPRATSYASAVQPALFAGGASIDTGAIRYDSKNINGFTGSATYKFAMNSGSTVEAPYSAGGAGYRVAGLYTKGNVTGALGYWSDNKTTGSGKADSGTFVGAAYKLGSVTLNGLYMHETSTNSFSESYGSLNTYGLGGSYALTPKTVATLGAYNSKDGGNQNGENITSYGLLLTHEFMPGMKLYADLASIKDSSKTGSNNWDFASNAWTSAGANGAITSGQTATVVSFGLQYGFF